MMSPGIPRDGPLGLRKLGLVEKEPPMRGKFVRFLGPLGAAAALAGLACEGTIYEPRGLGGDHGSGTGSGTGTRSGAGGDPGRQGANPSPYMIATQYIPGEVAADA